ncbi:GAF domain-containing protein [Lyngbya aestuarii]|uniref:GAF domain-containing protein n=1 Tax=Lyngbya aestuarii TaxID=118322 RepID=UPI00403E24AF
MTSQLNTTFLGVRAISSLASRFNISKQHPESQKAQLFGDIASHIDLLDINYIYQRTVEGAREILQADRVMIYNFDADLNGTITAESVVPGYTKSLHDQITDTCLQESKGGLYRNGRICAINDIYRAGLADCHIQMLEKYQIRANLVVPLLKNNHLLGLLIANQCNQPRVWQPEDIDFLVQLAAQVSLCLGDKSFLKLRAKAGQESSFSRVALRLRESLEPEVVFNTAAREIRQVLEVDRVVICRLSPSNQEGKIFNESVVSAWPSMLDRQLAVPESEERYLEGFARGYLQPISNILQEATLKDTEITLSEQYQIKSSLVAPIHLGKQLIGLIIAHQCSTTRTWETSTIELFKELAVQVSFALEQATLLKTAAIERQRTQLVADFTCRIRRSLTSEEILSTSLEEIRNTLETDRVLLYHFNPDGKSGEIRSQAVVTGCSEAQGLVCNKLVEFENLGAYRMGKVGISYNVYRDGLTPTHYKILESLQIKASLVAPIFQRNQLVGFLCAHQCSGSRDWQEPELLLLKSLAAQIGFALEQAQLMEQIRGFSTQQHQQNQSLQEQLSDLIRDFEGIAEGDLTVRTQVKDDDFSTLAVFFNMIIESLQAIAVQVKKSTTQVNASLGENSGAIRQLATAAFKQAQETTRILGSVEQMTYSIQEVADYANRAAKVAHTATITAEAGTKTIERTVDKISKLRETVATVAKKVELFGESSQQISQVVSLINQIALQTNLLAMNAGLEAAKAGKEGQGFAAVAKQVSELAQRSTRATQEIEQIVEKIQQETTQVAKVIKQGTSEVTESTELAEETKQYLSQILEVSRQIDQLVASISQNTVSQVDTSQVVTELIKQITQASEETSKSSEQISGSLQQTVAVAQQLKASVGVFKVDE